MRNIIVVTTIMIASAAIPIPVESQPQAQEVGSIGVGMQAPTFVSTDANGLKFASASTLGKPTVFFFFCSCLDCRMVATAWAHTQQQNSTMFLKDGNFNSVIVISMDKTFIRGYVKKVGLSSALTRVIPDDDDIGYKQFGVSPCPRAFVVDEKGKVVYTNSRSDDRPQAGNAKVIVSRVMANLTLVRDNLQKNQSHVEQKKTTLGSPDKSISSTR